LQAIPENLPVPLLDQVTFPVGEAPITVTLHLTGEPTTAADETVGAKGDDAVAVVELTVVADV